MGRFHFRLMSLSFRLRDLFVSPEGVVREADIEPGQRVLDYGCGTGSHALAAAKLVGGSGKVYALDISPLAVGRVERLARKRGLANVETILSDRATGLEDGSVDVALLYDVFHGLGSPETVLDELHRVLGPKGLMSFSDHHLREADILARLTAGGRFGLLRKGPRTYTFSRGD